MVVVCCTGRSCKPAWVARRTCSLAGSCVCLFAGSHTRHAGSNDVRRRSPASRRRRSRSPRSPPPPSPSSSSRAAASRRSRACRPRFAGRARWRRCCSSRLTSGSAAAFKPTRVFWHATHWVALLLGWLGTETLCEYYYAGEFDARSRARAAVRANLTFYGGVAALCAATALYLLVWLQLPARALLGVAAVLVDGYGLAVVALLQGHGLVALPRALWRTAAPRARLQRLHARLGALDGERHAAARRLAASLARVRAADAAAPPPASRGARERECWEVVRSRAAPPPRRATRRRRRRASASAGLRTAWSQTLGTPLKYSEPTLARMHRRVKAAALAAHTCRLRRRAALGRAVTLQRALVAVAKGFGGVGASEPDGTSILWLRCSRPTLRLLAVVLAALSVYVLVAEAAAAPRRRARPRLPPGARPALALPRGGGGALAGARRRARLCRGLPPDGVHVCRAALVGTRRAAAGHLPAEVVGPVPAPALGVVCPPRPPAVLALRRDARRRRRRCLRLLRRPRHAVASAQHAAAPLSPPLAPGAADPTAAAALSYHGLCSLVLVGVAAFAAAGGCGGGGGVCAARRVPGACASSTARPSTDRVSTAARGGGATRCARRVSGSPRGASLPSMAAPPRRDRRASPQRTRTTPTAATPTAAATPTTCRLPPRSTHRRRRAPPPSAATTSTAVAAATSASGFGCSPSEARRTRTSEGRLTTATTAAAAAAGGKSCVLRGAAAAEELGPSGRRWRRRATAPIGLR